jgi:hypothetical protein
MYAIRSITAAAILAATAFLHPNVAAAQQPEYVGSVPGDTATGTLLWVVATATGVEITVWDRPSDRCDGLPPLLQTLPVDAHGQPVANAIVCQTGVSFAMTAGDARALADSIEAVATTSISASSPARATQVALTAADRPPYFAGYTRSADTPASPAHRLRFGPRDATSREFTLAADDPAPILRLAALLREAAGIRDRRPVLN